LKYLSYGRTLAKDAKEANREGKSLNLIFHGSVETQHLTGYSPLNSSGDYIQSAYKAEGFAVSLYQAKPGGFVYKEKHKYQKIESNEGER